MFQPYGSETHNKKTKTGIYYKIMHNIIYKAQEQAVVYIYASNNKRLICGGSQKLTLHNHSYKCTKDKKEEE